MSQETPLQRIRLTYARREGLRYVSHLDMLLVWERTLRRAGLPLAYSKGFHPTPRLHLAAALPLGFLSRCELADFWLEAQHQLDLAHLTVQIQSSAPTGLEILLAETVSLQDPPLQTRVISAEYCAQPLDAVDPEDIAQSVETLLAATALPRERRGKSYDLRPLIESLCLIEGEFPKLHLRLSAREAATGRPEEVLLAMNLDPASFRVERTALILA